MEWLEVCLHTTNEAQDAITNILEENGVQGVIIENPLDLTKDRETFFGEIYELDLLHFPKEGIHIKFYLPKTTDQEKAITEIQEKINRLTLVGIDLGHNALTTEIVREEDWENEWKRYYKPVKISNKITIAPTWEKVSVAKDELLIELDPGMAFGTGTHPTTIQSVRGIENYVQKDDTLIDIGCGSGVLSIAGCLLGAKKSYAFDIDPVAISSTKLNAELNRVDHLIEARENDLLKDIHFKADVIVANILAEIIVLCIEDAYRVLNRGGRFITAGIIKRKQHLVETKMKEAGFNIIEVNEIENWISIIAEK